MNQFINNEIPKGNDKDKNISTPINPTNNSKSNLGGGFSNAKVKDTDKRKSTVSNGNNGNGNNTGNKTNSFSPSTTPNPQNRNK